MSGESKWYVIHTYSGYENKVAANLEKIVENRKLQNLIHDIRIPFETVIERDEKGVKKEVDRKLFPSYVLVKMVMTDESWHVVRNIRGVTSFVGPGSKPIPLTDTEIAQFEIDPVVIEIAFDIGDSVIISDERFMNSVGIVKSISADKKKAEVSMALLGNQTVIEFDTAVLRPIN